MMKWLVGTFALLAIPSLLACSESVKVAVDCVTTAAPAVECTVRQTEGKSEVEACWDFSVTCGNGGVVTAPRTCQKVKDGNSVKTIISGDKLSGIETCGGNSPQGKLTNLTLNGKKTD